MAIALTIAKRRRNSPYHRLKKQVHLLLDPGGWRDGLGPGGEWVHRDADFIEFTGGVPGDGGEPVSRLRGLVPEF